MLLLLWPEGAASVRGRRFLQVGLGALMAGTVALLLLQGPYTTGGSLLGRVQAVAAVVLALDAVRAGAAGADRADAGVRAGSSRAGCAGRCSRVGLGACVLGLLLTWTLTDHSRTGVQAWLGVPAATVHLLAMCLWLGGLALLLVCVLARAAHASLIPVVPRFSQLALGCFVALGVTGAVSGLAPGRASSRRCPRPSSGGCC